MANELERFGRDCHRTASLLHGIALIGITEHAAYTAKQSALRTEVSVLGPDKMARNFGRTKKRNKGIKFGVGYDLGLPGRATVNFRPKGGWKLMDTGARAHYIGSGRRRTGRGGYSGRRNQRQVLSFGDNNVALGPIRHPGMGGKRMFTRALQGIGQVIPQAIVEAFAKELAKGLT